MNAFMAIVVTALLFGTMVMLWTWHKADVAQSDIISSGGSSASVMSSTSVGSSTATGSPPAVASGELTATTTVVDEMIVAATDTSVATNRDCELSAWGIDVASCGSGATNYQERRTILSPSTGSGVSCDGQPLVRQSTMVCPKDCIVTPWTINLASCPAKSDPNNLNIYYTESRSITQPAVGTGAVCPQDLTRQSTVACPIAIDCAYTDWVADPCPADLAAATPVMERRSIKTQAQGTGQQCSTNPSDYLRATTRMCPVTRCTATQELVPCSTSVSPAGLQQFRWRILQAPEVPLAQQTAPCPDTTTLFETSTYCPKDCVGAWLRTYDPSYIPVVNFPGIACPDPNTLRQNITPIEVWTLKSFAVGGGTCPYAHGTTRTGALCPVNCQINPQLTSVPLCGQSTYTNYTSWSIKQFQTILQQAMNGGADCPPLLTTYLPPDRTTCPSDCVLGTTPLLEDCPVENSDPQRYQRQFYQVVTPASTNPPGFCPPTMTTTSTLCPLRAFIPMTVVRVDKSIRTMVYRITQFTPASVIGQLMFVYLESSYPTAIYGFRPEMNFQFPDAVIADARTKFNNPSMAQADLCSRFTAGDIVSGSSSRAYNIWCWHPANGSWKYILMKITCYPTGGMITGAGNAINGLVEYSAMDASYSYPVLASGAVTLTYVSG